MSDEAELYTTWDDVAESWRVDELVEGRLQPSTPDDVATLIVAGLLRAQPSSSDTAARQRAFDAMMAAAAGSGSSTEAEMPRDPARIERTRQAMLKAYKEAQKSGD